MIDIELEINGEELKKKLDLKDGVNGKDYILTENDKSEIASKIEVPIVEKEIKVIEKTETIKEVAIKDTPDEIVEKINIGEKKIKRNRVEGLEDLINKKIVGGGSIARNLYQLFDVGVSNPTNNEVLKYNSTTNRWENQTDSSGVDEFIELIDVPNSYAGATLQGVRVNAGETGLEFYTTVDTDEKVKISATDTTAGYLDDKISVAGPILKTITNPGGNEVLAISIQDALADGVTKGVATFNASDFDDNGAGLIGIDYVNGMSADATHKGFLTSSDWNTFNNKQDALTFPLDISQGGTNSGVALVNDRIMISNGGQIIENNPMIGNRVMITTFGGLPASSSVLDTELDYLSGATSNIQTQLNGKVDENSAITGATKTKITYDAKGLVTAGADATTADIADSADKRYVTDAQLVVIGNTSGTNTGDVTVSDSSEIDFTLTGQNITAAIVSNSIAESKLNLSDVTTANATTLKHGFLPKLSGNSSQYLNGDGNYSTPTGVVNSYSVTSFTSQTSVNVVHNFGVYPLVQVTGASGAVEIPLTITHNTANDFTITFTASTTGYILATVGSPQPQSVISVSDDYTVLTSDRIIQITAFNKTATLPTAVGNTGREYIINNASTGSIFVDTTSSQLISGELTQSLPSYSSMTVYSDGSNYWII